VGTKERLAEGLKRLARHVPGIGSYQDKESLREGDKKLRDTLALRLDSARKALEEVIDSLQKDGHLAHLDRLGRLDRKLHQGADTIRFASRGYAGIFDTVKIGEKELEQLYAFDIALAESVSAIQEAAEGLKGASAEAIAGDALTALEHQLASFENKVKKRGVFLQEPTA
jgi:hypothetical protein